MGVIQRVTKSIVDPETLQVNVPYYLTGPQKEALRQALKDFPRRIDYYQRTPEGDLGILQGDGWTKFVIVNFFSGTQKEVRGIILSNSCDIDPNNRRDNPPNIVFAPLVRLVDYKSILINSGVSEERIASQFQSIKEQSVTNIFYLPRGATLHEECIAILDDLHTIPGDYFLKLDGKVRLFTLSMYGFYLFLLKLSIHFCRFQEALGRD
jgi:hypothetical protein